jgi:predicted TIM-barrel fold metal-dependent hydrolase
MTTLVQDRVVDSDSHLTEPPTLWTDRLPAKWQSEAPRVEVAADGVTERWRIGDSWGARIGSTATAGEFYLPDCPARFADIDPACYDASARLAWMDQHGIYAQVLYSNVLAFEGHAILKLKDEALRLACVQAYNDYMAEWASIAPERFVLTANLPFWDITASEKEIERCAALGHRGILWAATFEKHGLPRHTDSVWDRVYEIAQDAGMSINFHVGVGKSDEEMDLAHMRGGTFDPAANTQRSALGWLSNATTVSDLITSGLCHRFPRLNFVSVESGFGYFPYLIESLDWQWRGAGADVILKDRLLPSEYFFRQIYTSFWFEKNSLRLLDLMPENVMFETDFPHSTSLTPGSKSVAKPPEVYAAELLDVVGPELGRKVLYENAARIYHIK